MPMETEDKSARAVACEITVACVDRLIDKLPVVSTAGTDRAADYGDAVSAFYEKVFTRAKDLGY